MDFFEECLHTVSVHNRLVHIQVRFGYAYGSEDIRYMLQIRDIRH
jgi:hypothetical protein